MYKEFEVKEGEDSGQGQSESLKGGEIANLLVVPTTAENLQNGASFSGKPEQTVPAEKEKVALALRSKQLAKKVALGLPLPNRKVAQPSNQIARS